MGIPVPPQVGFFNTAEITQQISPGILVSLSLFNDTTVLEDFTTWAAIGIKQDQAAFGGRRVQLTAGYVRRESGLTWTGFYPLHSGDRLYASIRGNLNGNLNLADRRLTAETELIPGVTLGTVLRTFS